LESARTFGGVQGQELIRHRCAVPGDVCMAQSLCQFVPAAQAPATDEAMIMLQFT
jgi:hypothetical protein